MCWVLFIHLLQSPLNGKVKKWIDKLSIVCCTCVVGDEVWLKYFDHFKGDDERDGDHSIEENEVREVDEYGLRGSGEIALVEVQVREDIEVLI